MIQTKKTKTAGLVLFMCCFLVRISAQQIVDCVVLKKKIETTFNTSRTIRTSYSNLESETEILYERDEKSNFHLVVLAPQEKRVRQTVIKTQRKTCYANSDSVWRTKIPSEFKYKACIDSCNDATKMLKEAFSYCALKRTVYITGNAYSLYVTLVKNDSFFIWINKKTDKIERIQGDIVSKGLMFLWDFNVPFNITVPKEDFKKNNHHAFVTFPPAYSMDEDFDGVEPVFSSVDIEPEFRGGSKEMFKILSENIVYPPVARENGVEGVVHIQFIVEKDGKMSNFSVLEGVAAGCNEAAMQAVRLLDGHWNAGIYGGWKVRCVYQLPIRFRLE